MDTSSDWIDDALWLGDTTLVGVHEDGQIEVLTRVEDGDNHIDEQHGVWDQVDDSLIRTLRRLVLRDQLARAIGLGLLMEPDLAWAKRRAKVVKGGGYIAPSGRRE